MVQLGAAAPPFLTLIKVWKSTVSDVYIICVSLTTIKIKPILM